MYELLIAPFADFEFMRRALAGGVALSIGAAPIGVFLMLRRMSLMGDAMSHAILPGAALGYLVAGMSLPAMTLGGIVAGVIVAALAGIVARAGVLKEDATLAAFYLMSLALGVIIISLKGSNLDLLHVLFGSILALDDAGLLLLGGIASLSLLTLSLILRPLVLDSVDPGFLRSVGGIGAPMHLLFQILVVLNLVGGFHAIGTLLSVGMMMLPAVSARLWSDDISRMIVLAMGFALGSSLIGLLLSYHLGVPSGPAIIVVAGGLTLVSLAFGASGGLVWKLVPARHLKG